MLRFPIRSEFTRNVMILATGSVVSQAIPIALTPVLTRLYTPSDFGVLALFVAVSTILGAISNARYELAIMLPESDEEALNVAALGILIGAAFSVILMIPAIFLNGAITDALGNQAIGTWLYFVPPVAFLLGLFSVLSNLNNRFKNYKGIAQALATKSIAMVGVQIGVGLLQPGPGGLVSGQIASAVASNGTLVRSSFNRESRQVIRWKGMRSGAYRYRKFPYFSLPANLANVMSINFTSVLISLFYSVATLGHYSLVQRILGLPSSLIGSSIGQVFYQQATDERRALGNATDVFNRTVRKLTLISLPVFTLIFIASPTVFALVFGEPWRIAGEYARILTPLFAIRFVVSTVSNVNNVFERQGIALAWQVGLLGLSIGTIATAHAQDLKFETFLILFSAVLSAYYAGLYFILKRIAGGPR